MWRGRDLTGKYRTRKPSVGTYSLDWHSKCDYLLFLSPCSILPAMKRLCLGLFFLTTYTVFGPHLPDSYLLTEEYAVRDASLPTQHRMAVYVQTVTKYLL